MSLQQARDHLYMDLVESPYFSGRDVSACGYRVLDTCAACALIMQPMEMTSMVDVYGTETEDEFQIGVEGYLREGMDPAAAMGRSWELYDAVVDAVKSGSHLNGPSARLAWVSRCTRPRLTTAEINGHSFVPLFFTVTVRE